MKRKSSRSARKTCKEYWMLRGLPEEDAIVKAKLESRIKSCQCWEYYEHRFPGKSREEYENMAKEAIAKMLKDRKDTSGINNPAHSSKTTPEERKRRSPMCIEFYEYRYPEKSHEEHLQMLVDHKKLVKSRITPENTCTRVEYWLAKGYTGEEARKILSTKFIWNLERSIAKYGPEEGAKRFKKRNENWLKSLRESFLTIGWKPQSQWAQGVIDTLKQYFDGIEQEYILPGFSYDLRLNNKFIEFNGDYWHMNPLKYHPTDINKTTHKTAEQIWEHDKRKKEMAKQNNFDILVVWESDYLNDPISILQQCKDFLAS